jgi:ATP-dependent DNA helicase PIF1
MLNIEQQLAFDAIVLERKNIFLTGMAGCGKSYTLSQIQQAFNNSNIKYAVTASTGAAAILIDGMTLHRWAGIGLAEESADVIAREIIGRRRDAYQRWIKTECLIIDEISMIDAQLFDKIERLARILRRNTRPFGGMQVVLCGDFAQLPPVRAVGGFCFQAKSWPIVIDDIVHLTQIVRQSDDAFKRALTEIRLGIVSPVTQQLLRTRVKAQVGDADGEIMPTRLLSRRIDVDKINDQELEKINSPTVEYRSFDTIEATEGGDSDNEIEGVNKIAKDTQLLARISRDFQARSRMSLKIGAQVMLIYNMNNRLVNGSRGVVKGFTQSATGSEQVPIVKFMNGITIPIERNKWTVKLSDGVRYARTQIPLILAYAVTQHRSQGATLDCVDVDISSCFEYGQAYVALSRVRTIESMRLNSGDLSKITAHPDVVKFYTESPDEAKK